MATSPDRTGNLLLDASEPELRAALLDGSRTRPIKTNDFFVHRGDVLGTVLFPTKGMLSVIVEPESERFVEAGTVGPDGVANLPAAMGSREARQAVIGQIAGELIEVEVDHFRRVLETSVRFQALINGYVESLLSQASWNAGCLAAHHVEQRCARWLLTAHDRVDTDTFELKQEFLAIMLGVHRPSVSIAARALMDAGCIRYNRGIITIVDRERLEAAACSCYEAIRSDYSVLVPLGRTTRPTLSVTRS
jgi:CRP-like cAMP-binding protein